MDSLIHFSGADIEAGDHVVVYGLDMDIAKGDFVYIVGKVGTGKTSIIRTIMAENPLHSGEGRVCGFDPKRQEKRLIRRMTDGEFWELAEKEAAHG